MTIKNNVTRLLDNRKISYKAHELPAEKIGGVEAANILNVSPAQVYKTIVVKRVERGKAILALVPAEKEVDLKALAKAVGEKKVKLTSQKEAENLTKLQTGGISPLALLNKGFQVVIDASVKDHAQIYISGGQWGLNIQLAPDDLIRLVNARLAKIAE